MAFELRNNQRPLAPVKITLKKDKNKRTNYKDRIPCSSNSYVRKYDLPRLLNMFPSELSDHSNQANRKIIAKLKSALRAERIKGKNGHWSYDLNRHIALLEALKTEIRSNTK